MTENNYTFRLSMNVGSDIVPKNNRKKRKGLYLLGEIKSYEDLVFVVAHTLSEEGWTWFYEPEMIEGNDDLVKLMCTIEGIRAVLSMFGISEMLIDMLIQYYAILWRRKSCDDLINRFLFEQHVPWPCIDILSLIREPCELCQVEDIILQVIRIVDGENM